MMNNISVTVGFLPGFDCHFNNGFWFWKALVDGDVRSENACFILKGKEQ